MNKSRGTKIVFVCALISFATLLPNDLKADEFSAKVVDGLNRPLADAIVEIEYSKGPKDSKTNEVVRLKMVSDASGAVRTNIDRKFITKDNSLWVYVGKDGYEEFTTGEEPVYALKRIWGSRELRRVLSLPANAQPEAMKELLAGKYAAKGESELSNADEAMFYHAQRLRPALRSLVADPQVGTAASSILAFIGIPDDLRLVVKGAPAPRKGSFENRWAYGVVTALLEPSTAEEWEFLRKCALGDYDDNWVCSGAIESLRLIGSVRSLSILEDVVRRNADFKQSAKRAIYYIHTNRDALSDTNLVAAGRRVADAIKIGEWQENKEPRFDEDGDLALIDCEFISGRDLLIHTATFQKVGELWKLRGVRETMQALLANPPKEDHFVGVWQGGHLEFARLELMAGGTGFFALSELPDSEPYIYRITKWSLTRRKLEILIEPMRSAFEPLTLENVTEMSDDLQVEIKGRGWSRKLTLLREDEFQKRAVELKKALEEYKKAK